MRKLSKDEIPEVLPIVRGRNTMLRVMLLQLEVGEILFMPNEEWKAKSSPRYVVNAIKKKHPHRFEYGKKTDGTGWLFKRIK
ncbi:MAG: hypothetical protein GC178_10230 [Flavobacteriales bacterium]|nr:hypothetical protein [Flavobacteriales bacterium]